MSMKTCDLALGQETRFVGRNLRIFIAASCQLALEQGTQSAEPNLKILLKGLAPYF
jgi:hypothetical protein